MTIICMILAALPPAISFPIYTLPRSPSKVPRKNLPLGIPEKFEGSFVLEDNTIPPLSLHCPNRPWDYLRDRMDEKLPALNKLLVYNCTSEEKAQDLIDKLKNELALPTNLKCKSYNDNTYKYLCNLMEYQDDEALVALRFAHARKGEIRRLLGWADEKIPFGCASLIKNHTELTLCAFCMHNFDWSNYPDSSV